MTTSSRHRASAVIIVALLVLGSACTAQGSSGEAPIAKTDTLSSEGVLTHGQAEGELTINWIRIGEEFTATTDVALRPDGTRYLIDDGDLFVAGEGTDAWTHVEGVDAGRGCIHDTATAALIPDSSGGLFIEAAPGTFERIALPGAGSVGCSFVATSERIWGAREGLRLFSVNHDGSDYHETQLTGPDSGVIGAHGDLVLFGGWLSPTSLIAIDAHIVEGAAEGPDSDPDGLLWRWQLAPDERPEEREGVSTRTSLRPVGTFTTVAAHGEVMQRWGTPGSEFKTSWALGFSAAIVPLGGGWINSVWISPRHFVSTADEVFAFGAFTNMGDETGSAMWRFTGAGWIEHRGAGPSFDDVPQIVHHVAGAGNELLAVTCGLNAIECGTGAPSTLWPSTLWLGQLSTSP